jgi:hypothetical protein
VFFAVLAIKQWGPKVTMKPDSTSGKAGLSSRSISSQHSVNPLRVVLQKPDPLAIVVESSDEKKAGARRMPAEWEPHWPGKFHTIPWVSGEMILGEPVLVQSKLVRTGGKASPGSSVSVSSPQPIPNVAPSLADLSN